MIAYRPDIDGLRAVAILTVVASHVGLPGWSGGYVGVDVFFVISGFLITSLLLREAEETGRIDLWGSYARRVRRLLPALLTVLAATLCLGALLLGRLDGEQQGLARPSHHRPLSCFRGLDSEREAVGRGVSRVVERERTSEGGW